uniref:amiloride-sensitive sodium channel subunit alpha-like n=1 Tax=Myxine glutinosa TaxID=7769 RepID=UPI00358FBFED
MDGVEERGVTSEKTHNVFQFYKGRLWDFYESYGEMFQFFCDNTTVHGTVRLVASKHNKLKTVFWALLFIGSIVLFYVTCGSVLRAYYSYMIKVSVSVTFQQSTFPAVTICNVNSYRQSEQKRPLEELDRLAEEVLHKLYNYSSTMDSASNGRNGIGQNGQLLNNVNLKLDNDELGFTVMYCLKRRKEKTKFKMTGCTWSFDLRTVAWQCDVTGRYCLLNTYSSGVNTLREWYRLHYMDLMAQAPTTSRKANSSIWDLVFSCEFNGVPCQESEYEYVHHPIYENCYTLNGRSMDTNWKSSKPGRNHGLSMIMHTDQHNRLPFLSTVAGAHVIIHQQNFLPYLEEGGLDIRPGTETTVVVNMKQVSRLPEPYGNCTVDGSDVNVTNIYNSSYTFQACVQSRFQHLMVKTCGCAYYFYPLPSQAKYCRQDEFPTWPFCYYQLHHRFVSGDLGFIEQCPVLCHSTHYQLMAEYGRWPAQTSENLILQLLSTESAYGNTTSRNDLAKLEVYFGELNHNSYEETPAVTLVWFLSSIGSQFSLWFGSSVLSAIEVVELLIDCIIMAAILAWQCIRRRQGSQTKSVANKAIAGRTNSFQAQADAILTQRTAAVERPVTRRSLILPAHGQVCVVAVISSPPPNYALCEPQVPPHMEISLPGMVHHQEGNTNLLSVDQTEASFTSPV